MPTLAGTICQTFEIVFGESIDAIVFSRRRLSDKVQDPLSTRSPGDVAGSGEAATVGGATSLAGMMATIQVSGMGVGVCVGGVGVCGRGGGR